METIPQWLGFYLSISIGCSIGSFLATITINLINGVFESKDTE